MWLLRNKQLNVNSFLLLMALVTVHLVLSEDVPNPEIPQFDEDQLRKAGEEGRKAIQEKCLKVSGNEETFKEVEEAKDKLIECAQNIVNVTSFKIELDEAKKRGAMEEVFGKYCKKKPELLDCVDHFKVTMEKCMEENEKATMKIVMNITHSLLDFTCHKDGDRIAMFIAEGGFECLDSKKTEIQECANTTLGNLVPKDMNIDHLGEFLIIDEEKCNQFMELQKCVTNKLNTCENKTPANVVEALFKYIKKSMPCTSRPTDTEPQLLEYNRVKRQSFLGTGLEAKCQMNSREPDAFQQLNSSVSNFYSCFYHTVLMGNPDKCPDIQRTTQLCAEEFYPKLKKCLLPKEDFFVDFVKDGIKAVLDFGCKENGKNLRDFMLIEGLKCLSNSESSHKFNACLQRGDKHKTENGQMIIEKEALCKDIGNIKMCATEHIKHSNCAEHKRFTEIVDGFMESLQSPCAASSMFVNLLLLFGMLYYHLQKYFY